MKINKVISAEFKKLFARPGLYIIIGLLAVVLTFAAFAFVPENRTSKYLSISGESTSYIYDYFKTDTNRKTFYDSTFDSAVDYLNSYSSANVTKAEINLKYTKFVSDYSLYQGFYDIGTTTVSELNGYKNTLLTSTNSLYHAIFDNIDMSNNGYYKVLIEDNEYIKVKKEFSLLINNLESSATTKSQHEFNVSLAANFKTFILKQIDSLYYPTIPSDTIEYLNNAKNKIEERLSTISANMDTLIDGLNADQNVSEQSKLEINDFIKQYYFNCTLFSNLVSSKIKNEIIKDFTTSEIAKIKYFNETDTYFERENLAKFEYFFKTNTFEEDFATPLSFQKQSNVGYTSAYDYTVFALEIFVFIIIVYTIYLSANSIAGERSDGTLSMIATKPISRRKIFFGKFLFAVLVALILLIFSSAITYIVGFYIYGTTSASVLVIFSSTVAIAMHPLLYILIFVLSLLLKTLVFISIGMLLSSFMKNGAVAVIIGLLLYLISVVLNVLVPTALALKFIPISNINLINYFGNASLAGSDILSGLFASLSPQPMSIWVTLCFIIAVPIILLWVGSKVFKRIDLA